MSKFRTAMLALMTSGLLLSSGCLGGSGWKVFTKFSNVSYDWSQILDNFGVLKG